jgi:hypothetical protein
MLFALFGVAVGAALQIDEAARDFCADVRMAMKRADLSLDFVARSIRVPGNKLSRQLHGYDPFTYFWRFTALDVLFWLELTRIRAQRLGGELVTQADMVATLALLRTMTGNHSMLKAELAVTSEKERQSA